jgi:hypothetical protein
MVGGGREERALVDIYSGMDFGDDVARRSLFGGGDVGDAEGY